MTRPPRAEGRWRRRLGRCFVSADSYGLVTLLVMVTYVVPVSVTETWASAMLTSQLVTVWVTLHTSRARREVRLSRWHGAVPGPVVAIPGFLAHKPGGQLGGSSRPAACCT